MTRARVVLVLGVALLAAAGVASAQEVVQEVRVEGNVRIEEDAIRAQLETVAGEYYDLEKVDRDLRALYAMGYFRDVQVRASDGPKGKVVVFVVQEKPTVTEFVLAGNEKLKDDKIKEVMDLVPNRILDVAKIKANLEKIRKLYSDEGYFMADVGYEIGPVENNACVVTIKIQEYKKVLIKSIHFVGNRAFADPQLRAVMRTKEGSIWSAIGNSGVFKADEFDADVSMVANYYRDNGYADVQVEPPLISLTPDKRWMFITVRVTEGPQYRVESVDVAGELLFPAERLKKKLVLGEGDVFAYGKFLQDIEALRGTYTDIGFAFANVSPETPRDPAKKAVRITYRVDKGKLAYIERIAIKGNERSRDKVIRRELLIREGELFSGPSIRKSKEMLMRLGYFDEVNINTERGATEEGVNLVVEVKERRVGNFVIGVGFSSLENFIGTAQISHTDMWGLGHRVSLTAEIGRYRRNIDLNYTDPYFLDTKIIAGVSLLNQDRDYTSFSRADKAARLRLGYPLGWDVRGYVSFGYEDTEIRNISADSPMFLALQRGRTVTTSWVFSLDRNTVNNPYDPTAGSMNTGSLEWASASFGGDLEFLKYTATTRWYVDLLHKYLIGGLFKKPIVTKWRPVVMLNGELGYAQSLDGKRLPLAERFFLGGINSVRGFRERSLGPEDSSVIANDPNDPAGGLTDVTSRIGGNKYIQGNVELLVPIVPSVGIKGVLFFDIGNAFNEGEDIRIAGLRQAVGFGFRWMSPIGPLRFEWGFPLHPREDEENQVFEFGMGSFF